MSAQMDRIEKALEGLSGRIERLEGKPARKVAERKAAVSTFPGFTAAREQRLGGYCAKHDKGFAFASGYKAHKAWCSKA